MKLAAPFHDSTTIEAPVRKPKTKPKSDLDQPWNVIIFDDPVNLMSFVTFVIRKVFGYPESQARTLMLEVHNKGKSVVWTGHREKGEMFVQQLQGYQLLAALKQN